MPFYLTNSGKPVTREMAAFLRIIENRGFLFAGGTDADVTELAACAGISVARTRYYIEELHSQYLKRTQDWESGKPVTSLDYVLTSKARAFLIDNNLDC